VRIEEARGLTPSTRVLCPSEGDEGTRSCLVVSVQAEVQEDLFGDPFVWVMVQDPQKGVTAIIPSHLLRRSPEEPPQDEMQGDLFADRSAVT